MINKLIIATKSFRKQFGPIKGLILWLSLLKEKITPLGKPFKVQVPNIKFPIYLRSGSSDIEVFCQIFVHKELDFKAIEPVKYIIDAGANIGLASVFFINKFPNATLDALEIDRNNISVFNLNTRNYPNINLISKGLWSKNSTLKISNPEAKSWAFQIEETFDNDPDGFDAITINELVKTRKNKIIDILKIDIEGAEKEVFESDTSWLSNVKTLSIEIHDNLKSGCSDSVFKACSKIKNYNSILGEYYIFYFQIDKPI